MKRIKLPLDKSKIKSLKIGDEVLLTGQVYTARDQAHKRLAQMIKSKKRLPIDIVGKTIYYTGPTPAPKNRIIGSCGPTTSSRMDRFTLPLLKAGLLAMIGKGKRSEDVRDAVKRYKAIYFVTIAGAGALLSKKIIKAKLAAFKDLGPEAIYKLQLQDFPAIVAIDSHGNSIY